VIQSIVIQSDHNKHPESITKGVCANGLLGAVYHAKQFHPDLFSDLDPKEMHQEYLEKFQGIKFDVNKEGLFVYPPI